MYIMLFHMLTLRLTEVSRSYDLNFFVNSMSSLVETDFYYSLLTCYRPEWIWLKKCLMGIMQSIMIVNTFQLWWLQNDPLVLYTCQQNSSIWFISLILVYNRWADSIALSFEISCFIISCQQFTNFLLVRNYFIYFVNKRITEGWAGHGCRLYLTPTAIIQTLKNTWVNWEDLILFPMAFFLPWKCLLYLK